MEQDELPKEEWDYSDLKDDRISVAFFWEYARCSNEIKRLVRWLAKEDPMITICMNKVSRPVSYIDKDGNEVKYSKEDLKKIEKENRDLENRYEEFQKLPFSDQIEFIAFFPEYFPDSNIRRVDSFTEDFFFGALQNDFHPEIRIHRLSPKISKALEWKYEGRSFVGPDDEAQESILLPKDEKFQNYVITIPNRLSLKEIVKQFAEELKSVWPKTLSSTFNKSASFKGIGGVELGFSKRAALDWLGVLKRFERCGKSWTKFLKLYPLPGDIDSNKRKLREQRGKAREILKWFESGGFGKIVVEKKGRKLIWDKEEG